MSAKKRTAAILGPHASSATLSSLLDSSDGATHTSRQHRGLNERPAERDDLIEILRGALVTHHASDAKRERVRRLNERLEAQGLPPRPLLPNSPSTRKGNLAEIILAEYVVETEGIDLPVYRLRYNPNVDQSMKGDDVLAFDLDAKPPRILVGESKFRSSPRRADVEEIVAGLLRSHREAIPVSLGFIIDRLYEEGNDALAERLEELHLLIARNQVSLDYVGLLLGDGNAGRLVGKHTPDGEPRRLAMISLDINSPDSFMLDCFEGLS